MNNLDYLPEFEPKVKAVTHTPPPNPKFVAELWSQMAATPLKKPSIGDQIGNLFRRPVLAATLIIVLAAAALITAIGPQPVWAAVQRMIGYIPGIGFVQNPETVLVLSQPVTVTKDGVSVTVVNAAASSEQTRIILRADGLVGLGSYVKDHRPVSMGSLLLSQPDGSTVSMKDISVEFVGDSSVEIQADFAALPTGVSQVMFSFTQIPGVPTGFAPQDWQISIDFLPDGSNEHGITVNDPETKSETTNGVTLVLSGIAQLNGKTVLQLRLETDDPQVFIEPNWWNNILIHDINGKLISASSEPEMSADGWSTVTVEIQTLEAGQTYTLNLYGPVDLYQRFEQSPGLEFTFDPGTEAYLGQSWKINETLAADGLGVHLTGITLFSNEAGKPTLIFENDPQDRIKGFMIFPVGDQPDANRIFVGSIEFEEIPQVPVRLQLGGVFYQVDGEWQISFQLSEGAR